jgi:hypothetical protein
MRGMGIGLFPRHGRKLCDLCAPGYLITLEILNAERTCLCTGVAWNMFQATIRTNRGGACAVTFVLKYA